MEITQILLSGLGMNIFRYLGTRGACGQSLIDFAIFDGYGYFSRMVQTHRTPKQSYNQIKLFTSIAMHL